MMKIILGNSLVNDFVERILVGDSTFIKKVVVLILILTGLLIYGLSTVLKRMVRMTRVPEFRQDNRRIKHAH